MPFKLRVSALFAFFVVISSAPVEAQSRDPYYELQCRMSGAYCDRVYQQPERRESFDAFKARKAREQAIEQQQRRDREAQAQWQREQERLAREEAARQAQAARDEQARQERIKQNEARERQRQLIADRVVDAPVFIRWLHSDWPRPQSILAAVIVAFATLAYIGRSTFSTPPGVGFLALSGLSIVCVFFTANAATQADPWFTLFKCLLPAVVLVAFNGLNVLRGWHYLFVSHPATSVAGPPLRHGVLLPKARLATALRPDPAQLFEHPPAYKSRDLMEKARALREKIDADADLAAAAMRRDRARAAKIAADAELREARKRLPWWQRWIWW